MIHGTIEPPSVGDVFRPTSPSRHPSPRGPRVLLSLHGDCARCRSWTRQELGRVEDDFARWGGRVVRLESEDQADDSGAAWLAVVDEWDEVFHVVVVGGDHAFPDPSDLVEWVKFVAIQCPECEGPEGPWRR